MLRLLKTAALAAALFAGGLLATVATFGPARVVAQTSNYLPIPSNVCLAAGALLVAQDTNNVTCVAAVATGQVLASAGTGTVPAWTASPSLTAATIGASGTAITQIRVYSQTITPSSVNAALCAAQTFTVTGLTTADNVLFNPVATGNATAATQAKVSAADTLQVTYCNPTAGGLTPAAGTATVIAFRS